MSSTCPVRRLAHISSSIYDAFGTHPHSALGNVFTLRYCPVRESRQGRENRVWIVATPEMILPVHPRFREYQIYE